MIKEVKVIAHSEVVNELKKVVLQEYQDCIHLILNEGFHDGNGPSVTKDMIELINEHKNTNLQHLEYPESYSEEETDRLCSEWASIIIDLATLKEIKVNDESQDTVFSNIVKQYSFKGYGWVKHTYLIVQAGE